MRNPFTPEYWIARLTDVRARSSLLTVHGYCDEQGCAAREVEIWIKDADDTLHAVVSRRGLHCPICGRPLKCHDVLTHVEQYHADARDARCHVNQQRCERDHGPAIPASVLLDDRLPAEPYTPPARTDD
jgi:hypothetical protein